MLNPLKKSERHESRHKYKVVYPTPSIQKKLEKTLKKIPANDQEALMDCIEALAWNPRPHDSIKIDPGISISNMIAEYRIRVGDYRILYDIEDSRKTVYVMAIRKRNEATYR